MNKLKVYLPDLITPFQSDFVASQTIQDNVLVEHEVFHYLQHMVDGRKEECALKVDMHKTYDRVKWEFLLKSLDKRGLVAKWIQWIRACITTPT